MFEYTSIEIYRGLDAENIPSLDETLPLLRSALYLTEVFEKCLSGEYKLIRWLARLSTGHRSLRSLGALAIDRWY
jgi:hypothetical protein